MEKINLIFQFIIDNWKFFVSGYELFVRIIPTKWNLSIIDNIWKVLDFIVKNKRIPNGTEKKETLTDTENIIKVKINKHILRSVLLFILIIGGCSKSDAQIWQNFKGLRLVNEVQPITNLPPVSASITWALDSVGGTKSLYAYDTAWFKLRQPSSGLSSIVGYNGLTSINDDSVRLGGTLIQSTTINGGIGTNDFSIGDGNPVGNLTIAAENIEMASTLGDLQMGANTGDVLLETNKKMYFNSKRTLNNTNDSLLVISSGQLQRRSATTIGLQGTLTAPRIPFASASNTLTDKAGFIYTTVSDILDIPPAGAFRLNNGGSGVTSLQSEQLTSSDDLLINIADQLTMSAPSAFINSTSTTISSGIGGIGNILLTNASGTSGSDINLLANDDLSLTANGDDMTITAFDKVDIQTGATATDGIILQTNNSAPIQLQGGTGADVVISTGDDVNVTATDIVNIVAGGNSIVMDNDASIDLTSTASDINVFANAGSININSLSVGTASIGSGSADITFTAAGDVNIGVTGAFKYANVGPNQGMYIPGSFTNTATLDFPNTTTGVSDLTITVTGCVAGQSVSIGVPNGSVTTTASYWGWVSATNTITIRFSPKAVGGENPASGTFRATCYSNQ